ISLCPSVASKRCQTLMGPPSAAALSGHALLVLSCAPPLRFGARSRRHLFPFVHRRVSMLGAAHAGLGGKHDVGRAPGRRLDGALAPVRVDGPRVGALTSGLGLVALEAEVT